MTHIPRGLRGLGTVLIPIALVLAACSSPEVAVSSATDDQPAATSEDTTETDDPAPEETDGDDDGQATEDEAAGERETSDAPSSPAPTSAPASDDGNAGSTKPSGTTQSSGGDKTATSTPAPRRVTTHGFSGSTDCDATSQRSPGAYFVAPMDGAAVGPGPVKVEFVGCSDTFEANVVYEAYHGHNSKPTLSGYTMGGTLGDWDEFRFTETFWTPGRWRVVLQEIDAESGDLRLYDEVTFTVAP